jgi:hypothetical protein
VRVFLAKQFQFGPYLFWIGVCIVVLVAASIVVLWYRAKVLGRDRGDVQSGLLDELREMRNRGELSEDEYAAAKHAMVSRASGKPVPAPKRSATAEWVAPPGFDLTGQPLPKPPQQPGV